MTGSSKANPTTVSKSFPRSYSSWSRKGNHFIEYYVKDLNLTKQLTEEVACFSKPPEEEDDTPDTPLLSHAAMDIEFTVIKSKRKKRKRSNLDSTAPAQPTNDEATLSEYISECEIQPSPDETQPFQDETHPFQDQTQPRQDQSQDLDIQKKGRE